MDRFLDRLRLRSAAPIALLAAVVPFVSLGGLDPRWALLALGLVVVWAGLAPTPAPALRPETRQEVRSKPEASASSTAAARPRAADAAAHALPVLESLPISMLDALPDAAVLLDSRGLVVASNAAARAISAVLVGRPHSHWIRAPELLEATDAAIRTGVQQSCHVRLFTPVERSLSALVTPVAGRGDAIKPSGVLLVLRDLTDQEQLTRLRADFVANASHELRTPLASIRGFVETLQGAAKNDPAAQTRFLGIMQAQAERMSRLIEDLLSLSRIEMREHVAPTAPTDLVDVVRDAIEALRPDAEKAKIDLSARFVDGDTQIIGDRDELAQVAQNLIQNAIKYGRSGGRVDVSVERSGASIQLKVADDGIGIAPEHLPRLTERFYRVNAKDSKERGGTGLGLAIVKHIVNRHRGELQVTSTPGKGSTFAVVLPGVAGGT